MRKRWLVLVAACVLLLLACDASSLVGRFLPQKEIEQASATLQAVAPTIAAISTTAPSVNLPASTGNPFTDAMAKAKTATKFRVEFSWIIGAMEKTKYQERPLFDFNGEVDGQNAHMVARAGVPAKDANTPVEIVEAGGVTYMKGASLPGMTDAKAWYITDELTTSSFSEFATVDAYKDWVSGVLPGDIKKARPETLDNQNCDVYLYDLKTLQNAALLGLLAFAGDTSAFSAIDKGEVSFWMCADGYVHKFLLDYQGHNPKDATQKAGLKMNWHAWDFGSAAIAVTAPKDAKKLQK